MGAWEFYSVRKRRVRTHQRLPAPSSPGSVVGKVFDRRVAVRELYLFFLEL